MKTGVCKFFKGDSGYGFITEDGGSDIFVHITGCVDEIQKGDRVQFNTKEGKRGLNAIDVQIIAA